MATKKKSTPQRNQSSDQTVTRIVATDSGKQTKKPTEPAVTSKASKPPKAQKQSRNPLKAIGEYFKGAWTELRQVRWPSRRATWGLTLAVLAFTAAFVVLILLLDAVFKYFFELMIGQ